MQKFFPYHIADDAIPVGDSGTWQKILPGEGMLSALDLEFRATNGATSNLLSPIPYILSRIELIGDGKDKFLSLSGQALFKYLAAINGAFSSGVYDEYLSIEQAVRYHIPFGRFLGDKEYGINLSRYGEVRLDVTYNLATINAVGASGFVTGSARADVVGYLTPPGIALSPKGSRRVIERKAWTSGASGDETWALIQDYPYTALGVYAREASTLDSANITNVRLETGAGKPKLFDYEWIEATQMMQRLYPGIFKFAQRIYQTDAGTPIGMTGVIRKLLLSMEQSITVGTTDSPHYTAASIAGDIVTLEGWLIEGSGTWSANAADTTLRRIFMETEGDHVGNLVLIPLADPKTWEDSLQPSEAKDAELQITQGNAGATCYVISEQIIPQ